MIENETKIATLEGNVLSGKTTLAEGLRARHSYSVIEEYDVYAGGGQNFPFFPPADYSEAKKSIDFFMELEKRRSGEAINQALKTNKGVIFDRSFYSCISFQYVVKDLLVNIPNAYLYSIETFLKHSERQEVVIPPVLIYLEPENADALKIRMAKRGRVPIQFLNEQATFSVMRLWYDNLIGKCYTDNNGVVLKSAEGRQESDLEYANRFISTANFRLDRMAVVAELSKNDK